MNEEEAQIILKTPGDIFQIHRGVTAHDERNERSKS